MLKIKCLQISSIMAEPRNSMQSFGQKDILSAALGQSGLIFTETIDDDVKDVFAALAEDVDYPTFMPQQKLGESKGKNLKTDQKAAKFETSESYENDLDDLMDLISNDTGSFQQPKQPDDNWPKIAGPAQVTSNTQTPVVNSGPATSSNLAFNSLLNDLKYDATPQPASSFSLDSFLSVAKQEPSSSFPSLKLGIENQKIPGLKAIINEKR